MDYSLGEPENPMSDEDIIERFKELAAYSGIRETIANKVIEDVFSNKVIII